MTSDWVVWALCQKYVVQCAPPCRNQPTASGACVTRVKRPVANAKITLPTPPIPATRQILGLYTSVPLARFQWQHPECMTDTERALLTGEIFSDDHLADQPPDRCQSCIETRQHAVNRILAVVRTEDGKFVLLYDYLG